MHVPDFILTRRVLVRAMSSLLGAGVLEYARPVGARALAARQATPVSETEPRFAEAIALIDEVIAGLMTRDGSPGVALAVIDRDGLLFSREYGYANLAAQLPVEPETLFEFGSIGKSFTTVCLLQLVEEGAIDLHAPVTAYLPWFAVQSDYPAITLNDLLTHTSGLITGSEFSPDAAYEVYALRELGVSGAPGAAFHYSNDGYKALGLVLQAVAGKPYREIIQERIFDPLGMVGAANAITSEVRRRLATGYSPWFDDRPPVTTNGVVEATWLETTTADGSLAASASELGIFLQMLLNGGAGPHGRLLSEESVALMRQPFADMGNGFSYGYATMIGTLDDQPVIGHTGGMVGYVSTMFGLPESGIGAVVLINGLGDPIAMAQFSLQAVSAALNGEPLPEAPPLVDPLAVENAADYAGSYLGEAGTISLEPSGIGLDLVTAGERTPLLNLGPDTFLADRPGFALFPLRAMRDEAGRVTELTHGPDWYRGEGYDGPETFATPEGWQAFPGHYRSYNPWRSNFRVGIRKGQLWLFWPDGREEVLEPLGDGFQPTAEANSPLRLSFDGLVDGLAQRARWNDGDDFYYRFFTP